MLGDSASAPLERAPLPIERDRKAEHLRLALEQRMQLESRFFDDWYFEHCALPELDLAAVDTTVEFLGKKLAAPFLISCMTGGTGTAERINENLALAAEHLIFGFDHTGDRFVDVGKSESIVIAESVFA